MSTPSPAIKVPLSERINVRMLVFIGVLALIVGYPVYILIDAQVSGGIRNVAGGYKQVDLKAMSSFNFDQANGNLNDIPEKWRDLNGQKVVLYGEMWQPYSANNEVAGFDLCYSIAKCCFSGPPQVQHFVQSKVTNGKSVEAYDGLVKVTGTLRVDVKKDREAGKVVSVYQLDCDSVEPVR